MKIKIERSAKDLYATEDRFDIGRKANYFFKPAGKLIIFISGQENTRLNGNIKS